MLISIPVEDLIHLNIMNVAADETNETNRSIQEE